MFQRMIKIETGVIGVIVLLVLPSIPCSALGATREQCLAAVGAVRVLFKTRKNQQSDSQSRALVTISKSLLRSLRLPNSSFEAVPSTTGPIKDVGVLRPKDFRHPDPGVENAASLSALGLTSNQYAAQVVRHLMKQKKFKEHEILNTMLESLEGRVAQANASGPTQSLSLSPKPYAGSQTLCQMADKASILSPNALTLAKEVAALPVFLADQVSRSVTSAYETKGTESTRGSELQSKDKDNLELILVRDRDLRKNQCHIDSMHLHSLYTALGLLSKFKDASPEELESKSLDLLNKYLQEAETAEKMISSSTPTKLRAPIKKFLDGTFDRCKKMTAALVKHNLEEREITCDPRKGRISIHIDSTLAKRVFGGILNKYEIKYCYDPEHSTAQKEALDSLENEADQFLKTRKSTSKKKWQIDKMDSTREVLSTLLKLSPDIVIGEYHEDVAPKKALIDNMSTLKKENAIIALEHLYYEPYGRLLEEYTSGKSKHMSPKLALYLNTMDVGHRVKDIRYGYYALVEAAKLHGVRVVPFETQSSYVSSPSVFQGDEQSAVRYKTMNYMNKLVMDQERRGAKVVHLVGNAHITTRLGVLGISELNDNAPTLAISDGDAWSIETNVDGGPNGISADFHIKESIR